MNVRQILEQTLFLNKTVTLEFPSKIKLASFKSAIQVYKTRYNKTLAGLGEQDIFEGKSICAEKISDTPLVVKFSLKTLPKEDGFKILTISDEDGTTEFTAEYPKDSPDSSESSSS